MIIEKDIVSTVKADTTLNGYINGRIYPNEIVQGNAYPSIALLTLEQEPLNAIGGIAQRDFSVLFAVYSEDYRECREIGERLIVLFDRKYGVMGDVFVTSCRYAGESINTREKESNLYYIGYEFNFLINNH